MLLQFSLSLSEIGFTRNCFKETYCSNQMFYENVKTSNHKETERAHVFEGKENTLLIRHITRLQSNEGKEVRLIV